MGAAILLAMTVLASQLRAQPVRDSAGIRIVTHPASARPGATWRLAPQPVLEIGGASGSGPTEFSHIWGVARTSSGGVVVSDEPAQELRVFDAGGRYLRTVGRHGDGPGEFGQIRGVVVYGDTIYALDDIRGTGVFTLDGKLLRKAMYPSLSPYHPIDPWGVLADGSTIETAARPEPVESLRQAGMRIEIRGLFRIARDSRTATLLGTVPTYQSYRAEGDRPGRGDLVAFAPVLTVAVFADRICTGRGERYEIRCVTPAGEVQQLIRRDIRPAPVTAAARDAYLAAIRTPYRGSGEGSNMPQARLDQIAARTHFAGEFPAFGGLVAGKDGELWVSDYYYQQSARPRGEQEPASAVIRWNVFARSGAWIGAVDLPARFILRDAGQAYVLGVNRDGDGVERVTMYGLLRR